MINKQNLWFVTLFSLILILGIYYISIDDEVTEVLKGENKEVKEVIEINEADSLVALEVENDEEKQALMEEYQDILLDSDSTIEERNNAYENMQKITDNEKEEEKIKNVITEIFNLKSFVKIKDDSISIVIPSSKHNNELANNIIRSVQELYKDKKYITVKFN